ncbi:hypothetical protein [Bacteroides sp. 51]|uniref:hypothetical protein n=1 Tax=Bacteroides sp. 51 TaxID=2302938 RepID=UPI0013D0C382|nr:hypothetical protein [Bacteroides sp. 51]NDV83906.1 hypothetical protein [Bacteroides sp. 51]
MENFTIKDILEKRGRNSVPLPLWKLRLTNEEYKLLRITLKSLWSQSTPPSILYDREVALYFAEWWRREYPDERNAHPSKKAIANSLRISDYRIDEFYDAALRGLKKFGINPIRNAQGHTHSFRTLLNQGGLPIKYIQSIDFNNYKHFLVQLAKELKQVEVDWEDTEYVSGLPITKYLPQTFNNPNIYYLSMQIVRAIIEDKPDLLPYDADEEGFKDLAETITKEYNRQPRAFLSVNWELKKAKESGGKSRLIYSIEYPRKIKIQDIVDLTKDEETQLFSLYVNDTFVISYRKAGNDNEYYYSTGVIHPHTFVWEGQQIVSVQIKTDNDEVHDIVLPSAHAPELDIPQVFTRQNNQWLLKRPGKSAEQNAVLADADWQVQEAAGCETITIGEKSYNFYPFDTNITLHRADGEKLSFNSQPTRYYAEFRIESPHWLEKTNYKLITRAPHIRVFDADNEIIRKSNYQVFYRPYCGKEWHTFFAGGLPNGLLDFKIEFPDGTFHIERFYHVHKLHCEHIYNVEQGGLVNWSIPEGNINPLTSDKFSFEREAGNTFGVARSKHGGDAAETCAFRFRVADNPSLDMEVLPPLKDIVLTGPDGEIDTHGKIITIDMLYKYKVIISGFDTVPIEILYLEDNEPKSVKLRLKEKKGIYSLSTFRQYIEQLFLLYGFNTFSRNCSVQLNFGSGSYRKQIAVRRFDLDTVMENGRMYVCTSRHYSDGNPPIVNNPGKIWFVTVEGKPQLCQLEQQEQGYTLPPEADYKQGIVFSDVSEDNRIIPKYHDFGQDDDIDIESRKAFAADSISQLATQLTYQSIYSEEWEKVLTYFDLTVQYELPFRTFNCFKAIAHSPQLMIRLLVLLKCFDVGDDKNRISQLVRFEQEFAVAWHWINAETWNEGLEYFMSAEYPHLNLMPTYIQAQHSVLEETIQADLAQLKEYAFSDEKVIGNPPQLLNADIQEIRGKISGRTDNNADLPKIEITAGKYFKIDGIPGYQVTCLLSPVKAAENLMGITGELWQYDHEAKKLRRIINFYRVVLPDVYGQILLHTLKFINYTQKQQTL